MFVEDPTTIKWKDVKDIPITDEGNEVTLVANVIKSAKGVIINDKVPIVFSSTYDLKKLYTRQKTAKGERRSLENLDAAPGDAS